MTYCCFCHIAGFPKDCFGNQSTGISHQIIPSLKSLNLRTISFIALTIFNELIILNAQDSCQQLLKKSFLILVPYMPIDSRYLATVRLETDIPSFSSISEITLSL